MDFNDFIYMSELGFLIEAPVLTTHAKGKMSRYVDPKTGKPWRASQTITQLQIIKNEHPNESLYVHFTDGVNVRNSKGLTNKIPKFGINPMADDGNTPLGVYAYPIDYVLKERVPYGAERKHMLVFKAKKENVLSVSQDGEQLTDFDEIIKSLQKSSYSKGFRSIIEKQSKYFIKLIEKITQSTKEELKSDFPEYLLNYMFKNLKYKIEREIDSFKYSDEESLRSLDKEIFDISIFFKKQLDYFTSHRYHATHIKNKEGNEEEDYSFLFKNYLKKVSIYSVENIDLENLTVTLPGGEKKSLLDVFSSYTPYDSDRDPIFDFLITKLISKNKSNPIFEKFTKKMHMVRKKINSFHEKLKEKSLKKLENFNFPFKDEFIKIAKENNLDLTQNLVMLLMNWNNYGSSSDLVAGSSRENNTSNFVYRLSGTLAKDIANRSMRSKEKRGGKYYVNWTSILRRIGFKGILDDEGTGTVHSGESTQSVFFDPKQVQLIAIVKNKNDVRSDGQDRSNLDWDEKDSALTRWYKGILLTMYPNTQLNLAISNKWELINLYNTILKKLIPIHSFLRFVNQIKKEIPQGEENFKSSLARSLGKNHDSYGSVTYFLNNYETIVTNIKNDQELMSYAEYARELLENIVNYTSNEIHKPFPKPSKIRGIIEKIKRIKKRDE